MSNNKLTVLFAPLDGWGHINACHGLAEELHRRGHRVVFAIDVAFKGKLTRYGFEEVLHSLPPDPNADPNIDFWADFIVKYKDHLKRSPIEIVESMTAIALNTMFDGVKARDDQYKEIVHRVKPDVIVIDSYVGCPALTESAIPWILLYSGAPLLAFNIDSLTPGWSGLPTNSDKNEWNAFRKRFNVAFSGINKKVDDWYKDVTGKGLALKPGSVPHPLSKHLNVYMTPKELDFKDAHPLPHNWTRVDGFVRTTDDTFEIPESLRGRPGKLVFLSMGSFGCANLELMTRVTAILGKSEHKFIVAKGPLHDKYDLPDNMWGQQFVPQTAILPLVDLVVTHGGNNTVTETFFYGKPMLVLPLFADQFDNAQRLVETGLGLRANPFHCTEEELLTSVDKLVNDSDLAQKMKAIGERIRSSTDKAMIAKRIEDIVSAN